MDTELLLGMLVLGTVAVMVLAPLSLLQVKGKQYRGEKARFRATGKLLNKCFGSIGLPTHSFSVFSSGLMLSSMFNRRFIPAPEIQSVTKNTFGFTSCIEVKLQSGELLKLSTGRDRKLIAYLNSVALLNTPANLPDPVCWEASWGKAIAFTAVFLVSAFLILSTGSFALYQVGRWCMAEPAASCIVLLAVLCAYVLLGFWNLWLIYVASKTAVRVKFDRDVCEFTFVFGLRKAFPLTSIRSIDKVEGSKWAPHPLANSSGVVRFSVDGKLFWFNTGSDPDTAYRQMLEFEAMLDGR